MRSVEAYQAVRQDPAPLPFLQDAVAIATVAPGPTMTEWVERAGAIREAIIAATPSRTFSTPADVAAAVEFLASDDAANIHGATLSMDGGFTAV